MLRKITNDIYNLIKSSNGQCSVIFVYENIQAEEEQSLVISLLSPFIYDIIWKPKFMRIAECVVGTFRLYLIQFLIDYTILKMDLFIKSRDGYFLLRTVIKTCKSPHIQLSIINGVESSFHEFVNNSNGALLIQCIIHNFALPKYNYIKSCSRHLYQEDEQAITVDQKRQQSNPALEKLFKIILDNFKEWDNKNLKPIIECCIKVGNKQFEKLFVKQASNSNCIEMLILSSYGMNYIKLLSKFFEKKSVSLIFNSINVSLRSADAQTQLRWRKIISGMDSTKNESVNSNNKASLISNNEIVTSLSANNFISNNCMPHHSCQISNIPAWRLASNNQVLSSPYQLNDQNLHSNRTTKVTRPQQPILIQSCPNIYYPNFSFSSTNSSFANTQPNSFSMILGGTIGYSQPFPNSFYSTGNIYTPSMISYNPSFKTNNSQVSRFNSQTEYSLTAKSSNSSIKSIKYNKHDK